MNRHILMALLGAVGVTAVVGAVALTIEYPPTLSAEAWAACAQAFAAITALVISVVTLRHSFSIERRQDRARIMTARHKIGLVLRNMRYVAKEVLETYSEADDEVSELSLWDNLQWGLQNLDRSLDAINPEDVFAFGDKETSENLGDIIDRARNLRFWSLMLAREKASVVERRERSIRIAGIYKEAEMKMRNFREKARMVLRDRL